jgi:hypothetical protein
VGATNSPETATVVKNPMVKFPHRGPNASNEAPGTKDTLWGGKVNTHTHTHVPTMHSVRNICTEY